MADPSQISLQVTLNAVDITSKINSSISIKSVLTTRADTCEFTINDISGMTLNKWDELIVYDGATKLFAGYYIEDEAEQFSIGERRSLAFTDYTILLEKIRIKEEYSNMTDAAIIADLISTYCPGAWDGSTYVTATKTHDRIRFNRVSIAEAIGILADQGSADWYVDYDKKVHFFQSEENSAPFSISSSPNYTTSFGAGGITIDRTAADIVNRVEVVGGNYRSDDQTFFLEGTGQDNRVIMPFQVHEPSTGGGLAVWRNDGSEGTPSWTALTVKVGYIDQLSSTDEVLHYFSERVLEQQDSWPALSNAIKVIGQYDIPLRVRVRDDYSLSVYDAGVYFDAIIVDKDITTKLAGRLAAKALLAQYALERETVKFKVHEHGLKSGQIITISHTPLGINDDYLIRQVTAKIEPGEFVTYQVSCGAYNPDLVDLMISLSRSTEKRPVWREDEVLDEILDQAESLLLTEGAPSYALDTPPYNWGSDTDELVWDFGKWMST